MHRSTSYPWPWVVEPTPCKRYGLSGLVGVWLTTHWHQIASTLSTCKKGHLWTLLYVGWMSVWSEGLQGALPWIEGILSHSPTTINREASLTWNHSLWVLTFTFRQNSTSLVVLENLERVRESRGNFRFFDTIPTCTSADDSSIRVIIQDSYMAFGKS